MTNPILEAKINDIHSWWEVPCIAHFCSLFRASFNLIDFDIEDLEEALLTDDASDSGNTLIQELIVRLLRGYYGNNSISTFNYQMFLRRLFRQKCREFDCYNPFDNDMDFQFLPMRTKVEILHMLCDFRLDADDVLDILRDLDSDSLRVHPLGYDANKSAYWYFYGTRLYKEDYPKKKKEEKKRGRKRKKGRNKEEDSEEEELELGSGIWQVICFTESDWERLALSTEDAVDKNEQALHQIIAEDFLPEIPKLFQEKERLQRKRFLELHPRKSSRIEKLKRRKEEEMQYIEKYKGAFIFEGSDSEDEAEVTAKNDARNARHERWKNRNSQKEDFYSDDEKSGSESLHDSIASCNTQTCGIIVGGGRQTNNSLSSATGEIIIHSMERSRSPEWFDTKLEDLHIGMYKVLNKLKDHDDAWPFLEPVNEEDAPNYYKVVKSPMSLQWMEEKLDCGKYKTLTEFRQDFQLILANCKQYNGSRNEYTIMGENLDKVFEASINRYIQPNNSSDGEDVTESSDFPDLIGSHKRRKKKRRRRTCSKSTEDADKENERKLSALDTPYSVMSIESDTRNADDSLSIESRIGEHKPIKRGKGRPPKNASAFDALDIIAEQTLRDINKWLNDTPNTPKFTDFCSITDSPPPSILPKSEVSSDIVSSTTANEITVQKPTIKPYKHKESTKRKSIKENHHKHLQLIKQRRRDIQRTIDRLQPGKSKGNLISTIGKSSNNKTNSNDEPSMITKVKEVVAKIENTHRPKPMLSLGSVLSTDVMNLDVNAKKHTFSDNDSIPSEEEDAFSENDDKNTDSNELQAENLALDKNYSENAYSNPDEKKCVEEKTIQEGNCKSDSIVNVASENVKTAANLEKSDKPTPNLSAWFKAFGAPKAQQTPKRKTETPSFNENPSTPLSNEELKDEDIPVTNYKLQSKHVLENDRYDINEPPPPTPGRFFLYEEDKNHKISSAPLQSPDSKPIKRQRRLSTGSSMSERSSFSQDPNDPLSSPHPSLDEMSYQSPQHYHQSPIHNTGALKVGFYQDTFPKCGSDKSNSCSPREPMNNFSPQHPVFSPRDSVTSPRDSIASPREIVTSPRGESITSPRDAMPNYQLASPRNIVTSPRYTAVSPRDKFSEPIKSPAGYAKSPVYSHTMNNEINQNHSPQTHVPYTSYTKVTHDDIYRSSQPTTVLEKSPFSIYPVKKRISAELEQSTKQQMEQDTDKALRTESPFAPVSANHETEKRFTPTPGCLPQHILPPNPFTSPDTQSVPISLSHHHPHAHNHSFMGSYPENMLLTSTPYFRKDMYVSGQEISHPPSSTGQPTSHISPLFMQQPEPLYSSNEKLSSSQPHYSPPRQQSPLVTSAYTRANVPLDFTSSVSSSIPLTSKSAENFSSSYHHHSKYHHVAEPDVALNYSNKNSSHHSYMVNYNDEPTRKIENEYQRNKMDLPYPPIETCDPNKFERAGLSASENLYRASSELKHHPQTHGNYRSNPPPFSNTPPDYYNGKPSSNYPISELRYPGFANPNDRPVHDDEQYYAPSSQPKNHHLEPNYTSERSMTELISSGTPRSSVNFNQALSSVTNPSSKLPANANVSAAGRYENNYHARGGVSHINESLSTTKTNTTKKSKKKKAATAVVPTELPETTSQNPSMYSHFLGSGGQANVSVPHELKHNGIVTGSTFNFSPTALKSDYQQYLDNLRNTRYFAESGTPDEPHPPPPVSNSSFQFLTQRSSPSFSLAAQAFMNANAPPCPSIYSSPYLQRPPEELLRPMMLQQGLMSAHSGGYPHGYINMHDPINRSPWL